MQHWPSGVFLASDLELMGVSLRQVSRAVERGGLLRLKRGAYCSRTSWEAASPAERHAWRVRAVSATHPGVVFSHWSAAALHRLPIVGAWPTLVHVAAARASGGRSEPGIRRRCHGIRSGDVTMVDGMRVTTVERTIVDLALVQPFRFAVAPADHALRHALATPATLSEQVDSLGRGVRRAARVVAFADAAASNAGESLSRGTIHELGFATPRLQSRFEVRGREYFTDFDWPDFGVLGEFDGQGKYLDREMLAGRSIQDVVLAEKRRENLLRRATGCTMARWDWSDALRGGPLREILIDAGLPAPSRAHVVDIRA